MTNNHGWKIIDKRNGKRVSMATFFSESSAWEHITVWQNRHDRGGRPDISRELLLNMLPMREGRFHAR